MRAVRDQSRQPEPAVKLVAQRWITLSSADWEALTRVKKESFLLTRVREEGGEKGIYAPEEWLAEASAKVA
jgi:hypothetical protein